MSNIYIMYVNTIYIQYKYIYMCVCVCVFVFVCKYIFVTLTLINVFITVCNLIILHQVFSVLVTQFQQKIFNLADLF